MANVPVVKALARALLKQRCSHVGGLGFYRRARMLHKVRISDVEYAARLRKRSGLRELPGIGEK